MARSVPEIVTIVNELVDLLNNDLYLGALTTAGITADVCFNCSLWNNGYVDPADPTTVIIPPIKSNTVAILDETILYLQSLLSSSTITDYGFKTQIERLVGMITDMRNKINSIQCAETCTDVTLVAQLLATLVISITDLITSLELLNGLLAYMGTCGCVGSKLFELLMGKFINSITVMNCVIQDWYALVMSFFQANAITAKSYVAAYVPNQQIPMPQPQAPMSFACVPCPPPPPCPSQCQQPQNGCYQGNCVPFSPFC